MTWTTYPIKEFQRQAPAWDDLRRSCNQAAFLESAFLLPLLEEFGSGQELLALNHENKNLTAGAILRPCGKGKWETFQPSQLPLGAWVAARDSRLDELSEQLLAKMPGLALALGVPQLDSMLQPRPVDSPTLRTQDYIDTAWVDIEGSFDTYWDSLGKNLRQNTKKQRNKLLAEGTQTVLECITDAGQVAQAMNDYGGLESGGWKAESGTAIHPDNAQGRFYRKMLERFCAMGQGRIYRYKFGDKVVSMDLCIDSGPVIIILKTAYDESYKSVSPSTLMRQDQFRALFEEGHHSRVEFYGKVMEWHTRWTANSRPIFHATCYRWPIINTLHAWQMRRRQMASPAETNP